MDQNVMFKEIDRALLVLERPSIYLDTLLNVSEFQKPPFEKLYLLSKTDQSVRHHPEGTAWVHTMMVVDEAAKVRNQATHPQWFMWSALLHDIGKSVTTKLRKGQITSYSHDEKGEELARNLLEAFDFDDDAISYITTLVKYHMHLLYVSRNLPYGNISELKKIPIKKDLALLCWCDRTGRLNVNREEVRKIIDDFYIAIQNE